jgi:hypothetical protein
LKFLGGLGGELERDRRKKEERAGWVKRSQAEVKQEQKKLLAQV